MPRNSTKGVPVTDDVSTSRARRRPTHLPTRARRLWLACAVSIGCHLVAVTLLAGRNYPPDTTAMLDGAISVYPNATGQIEGPADSQPPTTAPANRPQTARKLARAPEHRLPPPRRARVAKQARPATPPTPVPVALTGAEKGQGVNPHAPSTQPAQPVQLPSGTARSLRVYDTFPRLPELLRRQQRTESIDVNICVSERGSVSTVRLEGASPSFEGTLREAIFKWRYRPLIQQGTATPFCHPLRLAYRS
jgi:hypothetical protein